MPDGFATSYLPALSRLFGEVESPTSTQGLVNPQYGGSPEQLGAILQHPHVQQLMQQFGINFDPSQIRQSPFLPNSFMQQHPKMGGAMTGAMANVAATPDAPMVSGAGSGMSRAMQGMSGGPELLRQYQTRQMMSPFQAMGAQMPAEEFGRKQQLMQLLTQMEQDRQHQNTAALGERRYETDTKASKDQPTPYGIIHPGSPTPVPPELQGQTPQSAQVGSTPPFKLFQDQGQQPFQNRGPSSFQPYDPNMLQQHTQATRPDRVAVAGEKTAETQAGMPGAKVATEKSKPGLNRAKAGLAGAQAGLADAEAGNVKQGRGRGGYQRPGGSNHSYSKEYNDFEAKVLGQVQAIERGVQDQQSPLYQRPDLAEKQKQEWLWRLETAKKNIDNQRGTPEASAGQGPGSPNSMVSPGAPPPAPQQNRNQAQGGQSQQLQPDAQQPPRPPGVQPNYVHGLGPHGSGWYDPQLFGGQQQPQAPSQPR